MPKSPPPWAKGKQNKTVQPQMSAGVQAAQLFEQAVDAYDANDLVRAGALTTKALAAKKNHADALHLQGILDYKRDEKQTAKQLVSKAIRLKQMELSHYFNTLFVIAKSEGNIEEAVKFAETALKLAPKSFEVMHNLAELFKDRKEYDKALKWIEKSIACNPKNAAGFITLAYILNKLNRQSEAYEACQKAEASGLNADTLMLSLAAQYVESGNHEKGMIIAKHAIKMNPNNAEGYHYLGELNRQFGKPAEAETCYRKALAIQKELPEAWASLALIRKMKSDDKEWIERAKALVTSNVTEEGKMKLRFAIGKFYDDTKQYDLAFDQYAHGNQLQKQLSGQNYDRANFSAVIKKLKQTYTAEVMTQLRAGASDSRLPAFIIGMPRSGTSLTENIIASHPATFGAGELHFWVEHANKYLQPMLKADYSEALLTDIANKNLDYLRRQSSTAERIVDKMPANFIYLGLMHAVFPQARIIHTRRNPVDTCLSIYFQKFNAGHAYANDLEDLAFYYRGYDELMSHWRSVLPKDVFLEVPYELLIDDQENWSRKIIKFLGLEWTEKCMSFYENERKIATASSWQARQPIYKSSKERWRNYEKFVGPLLPLLDLYEIKR